MKKMRWSTKRKSVNEKSSNNSSASSLSKPLRTSSRLGNGRSLFESKNTNKSVETDIHNSSLEPSTPAFARSQQHPYSNLKANTPSQRNSKASSTLIDPVGRKSLDSQTYDNISEYSHKPVGAENEQNSIITNEEPINHVYA